MPSGEGGGCNSRLRLENTMCLTAIAILKFNFTRISEDVATAGADVYNNTKMTFTLEELETTFSQRGHGKSHSYISKKSDNRGCKSPSVYGQGSNF